MKFEERVTALMERYYYTPSQLGRAVMGDPNFVPRLRKGRQVTERIMDKVDAWMALGPLVHANLARTLRAIADVPDGPPPKAERDAKGEVIWTKPLDAAIVRMYGAGGSWKTVGQAIGVPAATARRRGVELGLDVS